MTIQAFGDFFFGERAFACPAHTEGIHQCE
jgi:hypothetical protein